MEKEAETKLLSAAVLVVCTLSLFSLNEYPLGSDPHKGPLSVADHSEATPPDAPGQHDRQTAKDRAPRVADTNVVIADKKSTLILVTSKTCGPCRVLKKTVLSDPRVKKKIADDFFYFERDVSSYRVKPKVIPMLDIQNSKRHSFVRPPFDVPSFLLVLDQWKEDA